MAVQGTLQRAERGRDATKATPRRRKVLLWDVSKKLARVGKSLIAVRQELV